MTIDELIVELQEIRKERSNAEVTIWVDGERYPISSIDNTMEESIEINAEIEYIESQNQQI